MTHTYTWCIIFALSEKTRRDVSEYSQRRIKSTRVRIPVFQQLMLEIRFYLPLLRSHSSLQWLTSPFILPLERVRREGRINYLCIDHKLLPVLKLLDECRWLFNWNICCVLSAGPLAAAVWGLLCIFSLLIDVLSPYSSQLNAKRIKT